MIWFANNELSAHTQAQPETQFGVAQTRNPPSQPLFHLRPRFQNQLRAIGFQQFGIGQHLPPCARAVQAVHQAEIVARHVAQNRTAPRSQLRLRVGVEPLYQLGVADFRLPAIVKQPISIAHNHGVVVRLAPNHHTVHMAQVFGDFGVGFDAAVDDDFQIGKVLF